MTFFDVGRRSKPAEPVDTVEQIVTGLTWMIGPVAPTPALRDPPRIRVSGPAGGKVEVILHLINAQRSATAVRVGVGSLMSSKTGRVWRPPVSTFVSLRPHDSIETPLRLDIPTALHSGAYEGVLVLVAVESGRASIEVEVT